MTDRHPIFELSDRFVDQLAALQPTLATALGLPGPRRRVGRHLTGRGGRGRPPSSAQQRAALDALPPAEDRWAALAVAGARRVHPALARADRAPRPPARPRPPPGPVPGAARDVRPHGHRRRRRAGATSPPGSRTIGRAAGRPAGVPGRGHGRRPVGGEAPGSRAPSTSCGRRSAPRVRSPSSSPASPRAAWTTPACPRRSATRSTMRSRRWRTMATLARAGVPAGRADSRRGGRRPLPRATPGRSSAPTSTWPRPTAGAGTTCIEIRAEMEALAERDPARRRAGRGGGRPRPRDPDDPRPGRPRSSAR